MVSGQSDILIVPVPVAKSGRLWINLLNAHDSTTKQNISKPYTYFMEYAAS